MFVVVHTHALGARVPVGMPLDCCLVVFKNMLVASWPLQQLEIAQNHKPRPNTHMGKMSHTRPHSLCTSIPFSRDQTREQINHRTGLLRNKRHPSNTRGIHRIMRMGLAGTRFGWYPEITTSAATTLMTYIFETVRSPSAPRPPQRFTKHTVGRRKHRHVVRVPSWYLQERHPKRSTTVGTRQTISGSHATSDIFWREG